MNCDHLRDYLQVREVCQRWRLEKDSTQIHWAIMKGILKPCVWVKGELPELHVEGGTATPVDVQGHPLTRWVNAWCYPCSPTQIGAYELSYGYVCDQSGDEPRYLAIPTPLLLSDVIREGVVMVSALNEAEAELKLQQDDELHGKERITLYRMLVTAVFEHWGWEPTSERSSAVTELVKAAEAIGQPVSYNSAKAHLHRAWAKCTPGLA
jgi:hypothetical protein